MQLLTHLHGCGKEVSKAVFYANYVSVPSRSHVQNGIPPENKLAQTVQHLSWFQDFLG